MNRRISTPALLLLLGYTVVSFFLSHSILNSLTEEEPWVKGGSESRSDAQRPNARPALIPTEEQVYNHVLLATTTNTTTSLPRRFPIYGTAEFSNQCAWTDYKGNTGNCTLLARPDTGQHEGISDWISLVVGTHILAQQAKCDLYFDYGPEIDMSQILTSFPNSQNWTVPTGWWAQPNKRSFQRTHLDTAMNVELLGKTLGTPLMYTPSYRFTYRMLESHNLYQDQFDDIQLALDGFQPENGVACSLGSLFRLSPPLAQFQPNLFTDILPALHRKDVFVMSLYIRTGQADRSATKESNNDTDPYKEGLDYRENAKTIIDCALGLEARSLTENEAYSSVVWMVVSDSQALKQWITETYDTSSANNSNKNIFTRQVITTTSRGAHTRTRRGPSTADLAEALLDWYLIGESDLVVKDDQSPSFGGTAALRTARPVYDASPKGKCSLLPTIHKRKNDASTGLSKQGNNALEQPLPRRFPQYGTATFARQCEWTKYNGRPGNCTLLLLPVPGGSEGISDFLAQIVTTHIYAQQAGCDLMFDYDKGTNVTHVVTPFSGAMDWRVPSDFDCSLDSRCVEIQKYRPLNAKLVNNLAARLGTKLAHVPSVRFAYHFAEHFHIYRDEFEQVQRVLPGFEPETAMACSLGSLFRLNPSASEVEKNLFDSILPNVYIESALVMTIYIRTGKTDHSAREQAANTTIHAINENEDYYKLNAQRILDCALELERAKLAENKHYFRVVWMVVADSKDLKQWIYDTYESKSDPRREIVMTGARGAHTRSNVRPSSADLSEALLDWYLIGESDLVISDQQKAPSFGGTGALRTARPLYDASQFGKCTLAIPFHERTNTTSNETGR